MRRLHFALALSAAALIGSATTLDAQTIGFKLGAAMSNVDVDPDAGDTGGITAFAGGGFIRFGFGRLGIQPELLTVKKGFDFEDTVGDDDSKLELEYIEIPVLLHLPLTMGSTFAPYVFGGPSFAFEVGCEVEDQVGTVDCDEGDTIDTRSSTDIGLTGGAGLAFAMGPGAILLEGRYTWGLTDWDKAEGSSIKNRTAMFLVGYAIPLTR